MPDMPMRMCCKTLTWCVLRREPKRVLSYELQFIARASITVGGPADQTDGGMARGGAAAPLLAADLSAPLSVDRSIRDLGRGSSAATKVVI